MEYSKKNVLDLQLLIIFIIDESGFSFLDWLLEHKTSKNSGKKRQLPRVQRDIKMSCLTNSAKPKDIQFKIIYDTEKQETLTFDRLEP